MKIKTRQGEKSFVVCAVHLLLAQNGTILSNLRSQNVAWEKEKERQTSVNLMNSLRNGLSMHTRKSFTGNSLIHQLPVILHLLEPSIRSVNLSLLSKNEKASLGKIRIRTIGKFGHIYVENIFRNWSRFTVNLTFEKKQRLS